MSQARYIVAISGASGAAYARRLIQLLIDCGAHVHLVVSPAGSRLLHDELGMEKIDLDALSGGRAESVTLHNPRDIGAPMASGSFRHDGMIIIPCSSNTLSAIATGSSANLMHRTAQVALKERRKLILIHRESPLSLIDIRNMQAVTEAGGIIAPASPGFYLLPQTIDDLIDFVVGRCLDLLDVKHSLNIRWPPEISPEVPPEVSQASVDCR